MSEIFSVQLTAVFTAILGAGAIVTAVLAGLAFRKQSQEVGLLLEQNKRDTDERRRAQAAHVFLAAPRDDIHVVSPYAQNASDLPVYEARMQYADPDGLSEPEDLGMIMPGETASGTRQFPASEALASPVLTFRDAAGLRWVRWPDGTLWEHDSPHLTTADLEAHKSELVLEGVLDMERSGMRIPFVGPLSGPAAAELARLRRRHQPPPDRSP